jgi:hypothetical protein
MAGGRSRRSVGSVEERFGDRLSDIGAQLGQRLFRRKYQAWETEAYWLWRRRRVFLGMIERLVGFVVMDGTVFLVMMVGTLIMFELVRDRCCTCNGR